MQQKVDSKYLPTSATGVTEPTPKIGGAFGELPFTSQARSRNQGKLQGEYLSCEKGDQIHLQFLTTAGCCRLRRLPRDAERIWDTIEPARYSQVVCPGAS
jgi:hypothetical protein